MILGGNGLVGHALTRRRLATAPRRPAEALVERDNALRGHILSVGLPIRTPDVDWTAIGAEDSIEPARVATWVFRFQDRGERIKR